MVPGCDVALTRGEGLVALKWELTHLDEERNNSDAEDWRVCEKTSEDSGGKHVSSGTVCKEGILSM